MDFSRARLLDPHWWRRLNLYLRALGEQNQRKTSQLQFAYYLSLLPVPWLSTEKWDEFHASALDSYQDFTESFTAVRRTKQERKVQATRRAVSAWEREFGDSRDPAVAAKIDATAAAMEQRAREGRRQPDEPVRPVRRS